MINEQRLKWGSRVTYCTICDRHVTVHGTVEAGESYKNIADDYKQPPTHRSSSDTFSRIVAIEKVRFALCIVLKNTVTISEKKRATTPSRHFSRDEIGQAGLICPTLTSEESSLGPAGGSHVGPNSTHAGDLDLEKGQITGEKASEN
jgi:hypothetical protein